MRPVQSWVLGVAIMGACAVCGGQPYAPPDRGQPGDEMIQAYLARRTDEVHGRFLEGVKTLADWQKRRPGYVREYLYMLGLDPMPPKTPLCATVTGTVEGDGYVVEKLHYQSLPHLYVTGNLYRPAKRTEGERLPAVFYVCGHSYCGRNGNKTNYQSHGIWLARHGYICLTVDSLQLGEIAGTHHGTYRYERWWWLSRGYVPSGVECLNGIRGIDYLLSRPDVDANRIAVTGISGGGAATFWIAAADPRVRAAIPVSGLADLPSYVTNRVINGHCDCMFVYNIFQWPCARMAALIAPRPMLFTNSDADAIFPMDANRRLIARLKQVYSLYGAAYDVNDMVSIGGHAYRQDIREAAFRFLNTQLKNDPRPITDSEVDLVAGDGKGKKFPIDPVKLRVFPAEKDLPADQINATLDERFVPMADVPVPAKGQFDAWRTALQTELRRVTFRSLPDRAAPARKLGQAGGRLRLGTEEGIYVFLSKIDGNSPARPKRVLLVVQGGEDANAPAWALAQRRDGDAVCVLAPRGVGPTRWTRKNPPNTVERSLVLLGTTADTGRIHDIAATARYLHDQTPGEPSVVLLGEGPAAVLAAYAALREPDVAGVILRQPLLSHMEAEAPALLNVLRVCDVPDVLGMLAPRPLTVLDADAAKLDKIRRIYSAAGAHTFTAASTSRP